MSESVKTDPKAKNERSHATTDGAPRRRRRMSPKLMMLARRTHLYIGLFLLPWVFLYGITGAMYNHQSLFPDVSILPVPDSVTAGTSIDDFPSPNQLAEQVVRAIDASDGDSEIQLASDSNAEFTNELMFEIWQDGRRHVVHIDPVSHQSHVAVHPAEDLRPQRLLQDMKNVRLKNDPMNVARLSAKETLDGMGFHSSADPKPFGWTKLNFLAEVDGEPARVTYVLKDGHVDVTRYEGHHGMSTRGFFLRLHTTHGQSPHWNGRMVWSLFVDTMAIAMVTWGLTGLLMWWQIKRTRIIGAVVMAFSVVVAITVYLMVYGFYANTML